MTPVRCQRCPRPATHALAVEAGVLRPCWRHAERVVEALGTDPRIMVGRREVRLDARRRPSWWRRWPAWLAAP